MFHDFPLDPTEGPRLDVRPSGAGGGMMASPMPGMGAAPGNVVAWLPSVCPTPAQKEVQLATYIHTVAELGVA